MENQVICVQKLIFTIMPRMQDMDGIFGALQSLVRDTKVSNGRKRRQSTATLTSTSGRKVQKTNDLVEAVEGNTLDQNDSSIESIVDALQAVPDMDDAALLGCL